MFDFFSLFFWGGVSCLFVGLCISSLFSFSLLQSGHPEYVWTSTPRILSNGYLNGEFCVLNRIHVEDAQLTNIVAENHPEVHFSNFDSLIKLWSWPRETGHVISLNSWPGASSLNQIVLDLFFFPLEVFYAGQQLWKTHFQSIHNLSYHIIKYTCHSPLSWGTVTPQYEKLIKC